MNYDDTIKLPEGTLTISRGNSRTSFTFVSDNNWIVLDRCFYESGVGGLTEWGVEPVKVVLDGGVQ